MHYIQKICIKINEEECVLISEGFDGGWSYLIWGSRPMQGYLGLVSEADAKEQALGLARAYLIASGRADESLALSGLRWQVAVRKITSDVPLGEDETQLQTNRLGTQQSGTRSIPAGYANA